MKIEKPNKQQIKELAKIYKDIFPLHNIFEKSEKEIVEYLEPLSNDILIAVEDNKVIGGLLVSIKKSNPKHIRARFRHIAVAKGYRDKGIGSALLKAAEEKVAKGKVEIKVSESEADAIEFYKKNGYELEGELKAHYRPNELCYILGKVLD